MGRPRIIHTYVPKVTYHYPKVELEDAKVVQPPVRRPELFAGAKRLVREK